MMFTERDIIILRIHQLRSLMCTYNLLCNKSGCSNYYDPEKEFALAKHTVFFDMLSFLYSIFDPQKKAIRLRRDLFPEALRPDIDGILEEWNKIEPIIRDVRHKRGFHASKKWSDYEKTSTLLKDDLGEAGIDTAFGLINLLYDLANKSIEAEHKRGQTNFP